MMFALRLAAVTVAVLALIDPALATRRTVPLPVEVLLPPESDPGHAAALANLREMERTLAGRVSTTSPEAPRARLYLGGPLRFSDLSVPVFVLRPNRAAGVTISRLRAAVPSVQGQAVSVETVVRADGLTGRTSVISLVDRAVVVARAEHAWTRAREERVVRLEYAAPSSGVLPLTLRVETPGFEPASADLGAVVAERPFRVLIFEPRPSWAAAFVRRALEGHPEFTVAALSRTAPRIATRLSAVPASLDALKVGDFDVVVVGAPEQLTSPELDALDRFASVRGGAVLLVPDTRLSSAVREKFALPKTEERLLETPATIQAGRTTLQASELLVSPSEAGPGAIATLPIAGTPRAAVVAIPRGEGTIVLSGLLDAWRYRSEAGETFWRGLVADLAVASPAPLVLELDPVLARPGDRVRVTARWRRDQISEGESLRIPPTAGAITDPGGSQEALRLWPGERAGNYEGWTVAGAPGSYTVAVRGGASEAIAVLRVDEDVIHAAAPSGAADMAAQQSGGSVVRTVGELEQQLGRLPAVEVEGATRPMRSPWWLVPFAGCLCIEWILRRKRGLR